MQILFTGASSFSGFWFVQELIHQGHRVVAPFSHNLNTYTGIRKQRIDLLLPQIEAVFSCPYASPPFLSLLTSSQWDLFCHHAAYVHNYKSPSFPLLDAIHNNVGDLTLFTLLQKQKNSRILLTGSVFEPNEGAGSDGLPAVSPYGLSKGITAEIFQYYAENHEIPLGKFVLPNPFGPYEEMRFTSHLAKQWLADEVALITHPDFVRDNIPITLLAKAYATFAEWLAQANVPYLQLNPSYYVGTQGLFTRRLAEAMRPRMKKECLFRCEKQTSFEEPLVRINTDPLDPEEFDWSEESAWDSLAEYYLAAFSPLCST